MPTDNVRLNQHLKKRGAPLAINEKYEDDLQKLIETGKEKGYLTFGEVNDLIPGDVNSADDLDDLMTTIGTQGIDLLEDQPKLAAEHDELDSEDSEDVELDLTPGAMEKTNDPVRMYLREMGTVPLLTREGEV
ncbi:RNA polymerase sigma factor RpoD, partial [mine drainage metagenome]